MEASYYSFIREEGSDNSIHYLFSMDHNLIYSVYFNPPDFSDYLDTLPYLSKSGCLFGFFPIEEAMGSKKQDPLVMATVYKILADYFATYGNNKVLLYHCDSEDEKQVFRDKLFGKWFNRKPNDLILSKDTLEVEIELPNGLKKTEYLGFVASGNNAKALQSIKAEFIEIATMLIARKR